MMSSNLPSRNVDVLVVGSGFAGLTAACLLAHNGIGVTVLEQNWLPGGCVSAYPRKHYVFEAGATTLVGLEEGMPLRFLLDKLKLDIPVQKLPLPMQVHLSDGRIINRFREPERWIREASRIFGHENQKQFWEYCLGISQKVWQVSLEQRAFPPSNFSDLINMVRHFELNQVSLARLSFKSMAQLLKTYNLDHNKDFVEFVNEQLLITAQNYAENVNVLFGATALCYTLLDNYYVPGGMINLVKPMVEYIERQGGQVIYRNGVNKVIRHKNYYRILAKDGEWQAQKVIFGIPVNDTINIIEDTDLYQKFAGKIMKSKQLNGAFSLGYVAKRRRNDTCIHHQIHLENPLPYTGSKSIFLSLSHPDDQLRCAQTEVVGSISTHIPDPENTFIENPRLLEDKIFEALEKHGLLRKDDLIFHHSSTPKSWKKWTKRSWGFVGGYPQYMSVKPWQMLDARLDHKGAYICGDSTYPGQGILGTCLSGIIAAEKLMRDGFVANGKFFGTFSKKERTFDCDESL